jgi:hypothetical protein
MSEKADRRICNPHHSGDDFLLRNFVPISGPCIHSEILAERLASNIGRYFYPLGNTEIILLFEVSVISIMPQKSIVWRRRSPLIFFSFLELRLPA